MASRFPNRSSRVNVLPLWIRLPRSAPILWDIDAECGAAEFADIDYF